MGKKTKSTSYLVRTEEDGADLRVEARGLKYSILAEGRAWSDAYAGQELARAELHEDTLDLIYRNADGDVLKIAMEDLVNLKALTEVLVIENILSRVATYQLSKL